MPTHRCWRDKFGLANHTVQCRMFCRECEESRKACPFSLQAVCGLGHCFGHRVSYSAVEVCHKRFEDGLFTVKVQVERAKSNFRLLGDFDDRGLIVSVLLKYDFCCL